MARHLIHLGKKQYTADVERAYTHVLTGQRNEAHFKPKIAKDNAAKGKVTTEQRSQLAVHARRVVRGFFAERPLEWCEGAADAEKAKERFPSPEWTNLSIVPVETRID